jgi:hypothetical protein
MSTGASKRVAEKVPMGRKRQRADVGDEEETEVKGLKVQRRKKVDAGVGGQEVEAAAVNDEEYIEGDDQEVSVEGDEALAIAADEEMFRDGVFEYANDDDEEDDETYPETDAPEPAPEDTGILASEPQQQEKKKRRARVYHMNKLTDANLGQSVDNQNTKPSDPKKKENIAKFERKCRKLAETVYRQAVESSKSWPLPRECRFAPAAVVAIKKMGVKGVLAMILKYITLTAQEILGRNDVLSFEDACDLPGLDPSQQYDDGVYYNIVRNEDGTISIYVGSATGAQGFVQRLSTYDTAMRLGHASAQESRSLHFKAFLKPNSKIFWRPLMVFAKDENVSRTHILIMEGLMMDLLETVDRTNTDPVLIGVGKSRNWLIHSAVMLEQSKEAYPGQISTSYQGLNKVSALKQVQFPRQNITCPVQCANCLHDARGVFVYLDGVPKLVCAGCRRYWNRLHQGRDLTGRELEAWSEFVQIRRKDTVQREVLKFLQCQHCDRPIWFLTSMKRHEAVCGENPDVKAKRKPVVANCKHCDKGFTKKGNMKRHEEKCKAPLPVAEDPNPDALVKKTTPSDLSQGDCRDEKTSQGDFR